VRARFELVPAELNAIERSAPELIVLELAHGERPFGGILEQVDWRLCGLVSRFSARQRITGEVGERVLVAADRHLACRYLLLVGTGPSEQRSVLVWNRLLEIVVRVAAQLGVRRLVLPLSARAAGESKIAVAVDLLRARMEDRDLEVLLAIEEDVLEAVSTLLPPSLSGDRR
jgi:hypothetical protein